MRVLLNDFDFKHFKRTKQIYIIGQPMIDKGMVTEEYYLSLIEKICIHFHNKKIIYIPHRDEDVSRFGLLESKNISIDDLNGPIEQYFLKNNIFPNIVIGFFSSALANLDFIFHEKTECYYCNISEHQLINDYKETVIQTVEYFKHTNVKRIII